MVLAGREYVIDASVKASRHLGGIYGSLF